MSLVPEIEDCSDPSENPSSKSAGSERSSSARRHAEGRSQRVDPERLPSTKREERTFTFLFFPFPLVLPVLESHLIAEVVLGGAGAFAIPPPPPPNLSLILTPVPADAVVTFPTEEEAAEDLLDPPAAGALAFGFAFDYCC